MAARRSRPRIVLTPTDDGELFEPLLVSLDDAALVPWEELEDAPTGQIEARVGELTDPEVPLHAAPTPAVVVDPGLVAAAPVANSIVQPYGPPSIDHLPVPSICNGNEMYDGVMFDAECLPFRKEVFHLSGGNIGARDHGLDLPF